MRKILWLTVWALSILACGSSRALPTALPPIKAFTATRILFTATLEPSSTPRPSNTPKPTSTPEPTRTATKTKASIVVTATDTRAPAATQPQPQPTQPLPTQAPQATTTEAAPPPTTAPAFTVINITSPISAGSNANVTIQTAAGASCFLGYTTPSGTVSEAQGLGAATADGSGICSWTWRIGASTNPGTGSLGITANGATQYYPIEIQ